jgi:hypothetical protein
MNIIKNAIFWDVALSGLAKTDVSEERVASILRVEEVTSSTSQKTAFFIVSAVKTSNPT